MAEENFDVNVLRRIEDTTLNDQNLARNMGIVDDFKCNESNIRSFFKDKCIFVTGGTGFMGKVLVEKLLRSCPEIRVIFLLIREKKGKSMQQRTNEYFDNPLFGVLKKQQADYSKKVVMMEGDIEKLNLGMKEEDLEIIKDQVSIIFNLAATVRFDEPLKRAVLINVRNSLEMLKLARSCGRLESFVHFSTAYANCTRKESDELFYECAMKPEDLINLVENTTDEELNKMTPKLLGKYPNTYTFSKNVAEHCVNQHGAGLPICIVRPSIVISTYNEPVRGWTDNLYGPSGVLLGAGVGLVRVIQADKYLKTNTIPVDIAVNASIASAWITAKEGPTSGDLKIYHLVADDKAAITWDKYEKLNKHYGLSIPSMKTIWYYNFRMIKNWYIFMVYMFFLHYIPGILTDIGLFIMGKKRRMVNIYNKVYNMIDVIAFFTLNEWKFGMKNTDELWEKLSPVDQQIFFFDMKQFDWNRHAEVYLKGIRVYMLKDPMNTVPEATIIWKRFYVANFIVVKLFYFLVIYAAFQLLRSILRF